MQKLIPLFSFVAILFLMNCSSPKRFEAGRPRIIIRGDTAAKDSIIIYETEVEGRQRSDFNKMLGGWDVITMRRQQKAELETLSNVYFELKADSTFTGKGGCNNIRGKFSVKGSSIIFRSIISTKMACENLEKENAFLNLLENRISEYTYKGDELLLGDGASNIVFDCRRK
jgi:heat shock protein HslJ